MSTYFSKVIKAGERLREFNFRQMSTGTEARYHVDVPDDKGNRLMFSMFKNAENQWKTSAQLLPLWIHDSENSLAEAIEENVANELKKNKTR
jgi:hypothetical protein